MKNRKNKLWIILCSVALVVVLVSVLVMSRYSDIYVYVQNKGWFREAVDIEKSGTGVVSMDIEEAREDDRFEFNQSLLLVNRQYTLSDEFIAESSEYKDSTVYMNTCIQDAYESLSHAVLEKTGKKLYVSSSIRGREEQEELYLKDPLTATIPGASEHETGLALDVYVARFAGDGFLKSPAGRFVNSHAHEYGFIMRYPSYGEQSTKIRFEPWHVRYVGFPHSNIIYGNSITLEEYIEMLTPEVVYESQGYLILRTQPENGKINVPEGCESYVVSPDNTGYYIVTGKMG